MTAIDSSAEALHRAKRRVPTAEFICQDFRSALPINNAAAVVASLSLHYFGWNETVEIVSHVQAALRPSGLLLCRLNSTTDRYFGAVGHRRIDHNFYMVHGRPKRFFDRAEVERLFAGWETLSLRPTTTYRFGLRKEMWELVARKAKVQDAGQSQRLGESR